MNRIQEQGTRSAEEYEWLPSSIHSVIEKDPIKLPSTHELSGNLYLHRIG